MSISKIWTVGLGLLWVFYSSAAIGQSPECTCHFRLVVSDSSIIQINGVSYQNCVIGGFFNSEGVWLDQAMTWNSIASLISSQGIPVEDYQNVPYIQGLMGDGRPLVEALRIAERDKNNFFKELIGELGSVQSTEDLDKLADSIKGHPIVEGFQFELLWNEGLHQAFYSMLPGKQWAGIGPCKRFLGPEVEVNGLVSSCGGAFEAIEGFLAHGEGPPFKGVTIQDGKVSWTERGSIEELKKAVGGL